MLGEQTLGKKTFSGAVWASFDKVGTMALQFVVNLILARLLMPSDFGCIGMLAIFVIVSQTIIDGGFGSALIQKKEPTQIDYSTIFYWNILFALFLYILLFIAAPWIASFYKMPLLCDVLRVIGINLVINSLGIIQINRQRKQLAFRKIALINVASYLLSGIVAIGMAYAGYGVWSLVALQLLFSLFSVSLFWIVTKWAPSFCFSFTSLKGLFRFGGYLLFASILQEVCKNLQGLIIGRRFSSVEMGLYAQAKKLDDVTSLTLPNIIVQVMFPVYSQIQDDLERTREVLRMNVRIISFVTFPLMILLVLIAEPLIRFLYGHKWDAAVPYFQILCVGGLFACLQNINYYAVAAQGKSNVLFAWSFYKWSMLLLLLLVGMHWGMNGILWGMVISSLNIYLVNAGLVSKYVSFSLWRQLKDILPIAVVALVAACCLYILGQYYSLSFVYQAFIYIAVYLCLVYMFKLKVEKDIVKILNLLRKRR